MVKEFIHNKVPFWFIVKGRRKPNDPKELIVWCVTADWFMPIAFSFSHVFEPTEEKAQKLYKKALKKKRCAHKVLGWDNNSSNNQ